VPGILWEQIAPGLENDVRFTATIYQAGYVAYAGDQAASYGALMRDKNGRLVMVFDTLSALVNPSIMVTQRPPNDPLNALRLPQVAFAGPEPATLNTFSPWGSYSAASYDGFGRGANHLWITGQYANIDWATFIART
jgi:hypothetical protein